MNLQLEVNNHGAYRARGWWDTTPDDLTDLIVSLARELAEQKSN